MDENGFEGIGHRLVGLVLLGRFGFVPQAYAGASCLQVCIPEISRVCTRAAQLDLGLKCWPVMETLRAEVSLRLCSLLGPALRAQRGRERRPRAGPLLCRASPLAPASSARARFSTRAPCPLLLSASVCLDVSTPSLCVS